MFLSVFFFRNSLQIKKVSLPLQPQTRNNGAIAQLVEQRTENPCVPGSIPGGTTKETTSPNKTQYLKLYHLYISFHPVVIYSVKQFPKILCLLFLRGFPVFTLSKHVSILN